MYTEIFPVENWEVLMTKTCHFYNEDNTPFEVVCLRMGETFSIKTTINGSEIERIPVIRWITNKEYEYFKKNSGMVIF